jgi:hypothetical protein
MLRLSRLDLGLGADPIAFDFHWADNFQTNDIADFGVNGDSAPDRRFNYRYQTVVEQALGLSADDFESGKQSSWGESWTNGSRWSVTSATAYSSNHSAVCNSANGTGQSALVTRQDTSALAGLRVSFRYKLHGITNAQNAFVQYYSRTGWTNIRNLGRDQYVPVGQSWSYDERQDVWMQFADARLIAGADGQFFHTNFAFRIDGGGLTNASQSLWVDDFSLTGTALQTNAVLNRAPVFPPIPDQTVLAGRTLIVTNAASDTDAPPQTLTFAGVLPPTNSTIDPAAGTFTWRPTIAQSPQLTRVQLKAQDNGVPSLSATQSFWVTVNSPVRPQLLAAAGTNRKFALRVTGDYGPDYIIQAATNLCCSNGWTTQLITNSPAIPFWWADPQTNLAQRFYRVLLGP